MNSILVLAELKRGILDDVTYELLTTARNLAQTLRIQLFILIVGSKIDEPAQKLASTNVDLVIAAEHPLLEKYNSNAYAKVLITAIQKFKPQLLLIAHTFTGMDLAPTVAARLDVGLASNCMDVTVQENQILPIRTMYGGKICAKIAFENQMPIIITLQRGSAKAEETAARAQQAPIEKLNVELTQSDLKIKSLGIEQSATEIDITIADTIVSVGRGIGQQSDLKIVEELAETINAVVACSRPLVDLAWYTQDRQVGLSGKTVKPKLYLACGISGAIHHTAGMKDSKMIIAINKDPKAPIFDVSDYAIVADLLEVIPPLIAELKATKTTNKI